MVALKSRVSGQVCASGLCFSLFLCCVVLIFRGLWKESGGKSVYISNSACICMEGLNMKRIEDMDNKRIGRHGCFSPASRRCGFGVLAVGVAVVAGLLAAACSSSNSDSADTVAVPVTSAAAAPAGTTSTTAVSDVPVLPATVPEAVEEAPTFPIPVTTTTPAPTTTISPDIFIPGTTAPPVTIPAQTGVSGFEFTTPGANGNVFYVQLGATHPLAVCFSYTDGNPRLSSLQAGTIDAATAEIADIGNQCVQAVSGEDFEVDVSDVAVGCVDPTGAVTDVCATGLPDFDATPTTTEPEPEPAEPAPTATTPTTTTAVPQQSSGTVSLAGLTRDEVLNGRLELFDVWPLPSDRDPATTGIGGFPTDEDFRAWETVIYGQLNAIMNVPDSALAPIIDGVFVRTTDQPEFLTLLADYENYMRLGGYTFYNTCASERFPQITPESSMLDFIHRETEPLGTPPAGRGEEWYADRAAQAMHDFRNFRRDISVVELPQMLLCDPLHTADEELFTSTAGSIWQPDDNRNFISHRPSEGFRHYTVALSTDRQIAIVVSCYLAEDRDEYRGSTYNLNTMIWEDGKYKLDGRLTINAEGNEYQSCEETVTDGGNLEMFLTENLPNWGPQYGGKTYDIFPPDKYQYEGVNLLDLT